jgi:hypothetical protein
MGIGHSTMEWKNIVYYFIGFYVMLFILSTPKPEETTCVRKQSFRDKNSRRDWLRSEISLLQEELDQIEEEIQEPVSPSSLKEWIKNEVKDQLQSRIRKIPKNE